MNEFRVALSKENGKKQKKDKSGHLPKAKANAQKRTKDAVVLIVRLSPSFCHPCNCSFALVQYKSNLWHRHQLLETNSFLCVKAGVYPLRNQGTVHFVKALCSIEIAPT